MGNPPFDFGCGVKQIQLFCHIDGERISFVTEGQELFQIPQFAGDDCVRAVGLTKGLRLARRTGPSTLLRSGARGPAWQ